MTSRLSFFLWKDVIPAEKFRRYNTSQITSLKFPLFYANLLLSTSPVIVALVCLVQYRFTPSILVWTGSMQDNKSFCVLPAADPRFHVFLAPVFHFEFLVVAFAWSLAWDLLIVSSESLEHTILESVLVVTKSSTSPQLSTIYSPYYTLLSEYIARHISFSSCWSEKGLFVGREGKKKTKKYPAFFIYFRTQGLFH